VSSKLSYRPEIDGMRAIAVASVVLFHMELPFAGGGFGGVDVFFVISGYLITSLIDAEMAENRFSFTAFYERRIRRLLPPLIPVLLVTWLVSYALLSVWEFADFFRSLRATLALSANWHFISTVGYFDAPAVTKPLLHFWSLAVEEQFYLAFPALLVVLYRTIPRWRGAVTIALGVLSLGFSIYLVATGKADSGFFNSFARFWEILAGAALALHPIQLKSRRLATGLEVVGAATLFALFVWPDAAQYPTQSAAIAVLGGMLLIGSGGAGSIVSPILSSLPFTALGKISYALYLWHWPIIVILRTAYPTAGFDILALGMVAAVALSTLSYWAIERPFRARKFLPHRRLIFALFIVSTLGFGALSVANYLPGISSFKTTLSVAIRGVLYGPDIGQALFALDEAGGNVARYDVYYDGNSGPFDKAAFSGLPCSFDNGNSVDNIVDCLIGQATDFNVLVIGDSIGRDTLYALRAGYPDVNFIMLHQSSCAPVDSKASGKSCFPSLASVLRRAQAAIRIDVAILAYRYLPESWNTTGPTLDLASDIGARPALLGLSPVFNLRISEILRELPRGAAVPAAVSKSDRTMIGWDLDAMAVAAASLAAEHGAAFIDTSRFFCSRTECSLWLDGGHAKPIFWDAQHLTLPGIEAFGTFLEQNPELSAFLRP
jgi:peptidoglycan/LPS O-acetylase OafA/YrhL